MRPCRARLLSVEIGPAADDAAMSPNDRETERRKVHSMFYTIAVVLVIFWLLGLVTSYTLGGFIHILLVLAVIMILFNLISGRRASS